MAEFKRPSTHTDDVGRALVIVVVLTFLFFGSSRFFAKSATGTMPIQQAKVEVVKKPKQIDSGHMNVVEQKIFVALTFVHAHIATNWPGSWGWSIILLTAGVNLLLLPLRFASLLSGLKLQRIQPQIEAIKARYKNVRITDPLHAEMAEEISTLQKNSGINPFGGCLPLLIQMPLLIGFFGMLRKAGALRGADWLWLHDLSSVDPYHVLPVLMVIFQLLAQVYTPSPGGDVKQQKIMAYVMTIGFGYVSWHYASGLALYAVTGSLLTIATQAVVNLFPVGREMRKLRS
jgi:YidC/Oxa1 family membrane protein insertase